MDQYKATLLQGKQVQGSPLGFPTGLGLDRLWETHMVTI